MAAKKKAKKKTGRRGGIQFLTPAKQKRFFQAINNNCTIRAACALAGMAPATFHKYQEQYRNGTAEPGIAEFMEKIDQNRAEAQERLLGYVERDAAADGGHKPAQWILERRHDMITTVKQEISGPDGGPIKHEISDARERLLAKLARLAASEEPDDVS
tara:strand:- start:170 stop:643 length:474 start_codon:yes stop_codon:yes gene_type:complete